MTTLTELINRFRFLSEKKRRLILSLSLLLVIISSPVRAEPAQQLLSQCAISAADLEYGEQELTKMLDSLPAMKEIVRKGDFLWNWAVNQFAGEGGAGRIVWAPGAPQSANAPSEHIYPYQDHPVLLTIAPKDHAGKSVSSEQLWSYFVFESFNICNDQKFYQINL